MSDLLNSASLVLIPSGYKEDTVYSVVPSDGSGDLSFTRASNGTRVNSAGLVEVCPWNMQTYSEDFTNGKYTLNQASITSNATNAPNGTATADKLVENTANDQHFIYFTAQQTAYNETRISVYAKAGGRTNLLMWESAITNAQCLFNLSTGVVTSSSSGNAANLSTTVGQIEDAGNGWYRCSFNYSTSSGGGTIRLQLYTTTTSYTGDGTSGIFIWGLQENIGSTAKPYFPTTDRLNVPRLTYQNGGGGCPSLLLEKQSTNYARNNNDLASWSIVNSGSLTKNLNAATSPDGTTNAINLVPNTANSSKMIYDDLTASQSSGGNFTMTCYAKANGYSKFGVRESATVGYYATFDLSTGAVIDNGGNTASIQSVGNGWYRCIVSVVYSGNVNIGLLPLNDSYTSGQPLTHYYAGDGTKGVLVYGPQLEVSSSYATSLISTAGVASATRVADACSKTGISSLIGQTSGTMFIDTYVGNETDEVYGWLQASLSGNPNDSIQINRAGSNVQCQVYNGATVDGIITGGTIAKGQRIKIAVGYANNDLVLYLNGTQIGVDTSTAIPTCAVFQLGAYPPLPNDYTNDGGINQAVLFKTRLTNAELASITTL